MATKKSSNRQALPRAGESRRFLYQQIADHLREQIDSGRFVPGERMPSMDELAAQFEVNKITVLKALDELKGEGVVYSVPAQGTYVTKVERGREERQGNRAFTVGLLSQVLEPVEFGPYHMGIISGIQHELGRGAGNLLLMPAGHLHTDAELYRMAMEAEVDGMIYLGPFQNALLRRLVESGRPSVVVDYSFAGCPTDSVEIDNRGGGQLAMQHLLELGHRRIAVILGPEDQTATEDRLAGMQKSLVGSELTADELILLPGDFTRESGYEAALRLLKDHGDCTALCCMNDEMAAGALQAIYGESTRKVPNDLSMVGFDDIHLAAATHPPLTSVHVDMRHMGRIAMQRLMDRIEEPKSNPSSTLLAAQLVVRESTGQA